MFQEHGKSSKSVSFEDCELCKCYFVRLDTVLMKRELIIGYRTLAVGHDTLGGAVFLSNPRSTGLTVKLVFYDQKCQATRPRRVLVKPGCTVKYPFPKGRYGYGRIQVSSQALINVLHFTASSQGIAAAELLGEADRFNVPPTDPKPGSKILFDDTHGSTRGHWGLDRIRDCYGQCGLYSGTPHSANSNTDSTKETRRFYNCHCKVEL